MLTNNFYMMAFIGGASGSLVAQIMSVPIDVISQHMMLDGQKGVSAKATATAATAAGSRIKELDRIHVPDSLRSASSFRVFKYICREIFKNESLRGFYRGYMLSTFLVSLNSALWWPFYYLYQGNFAHKSNCIKLLTWFDFFF
jgi:solute carrier family 25 protein 44